VIVDPKMSGLSSIASVGASVSVTSAYSNVFWQQASSPEFLTASTDSAVKIQSATSNSFVNSSFHISALNEFLMPYGSAYLAVSSGGYLSGGVAYQSVVFGGGHAVASDQSNQQAIWLHEVIKDA